MKKDLGILVNPDMKFKDQVSAASKKANKILGMIKRNFKCMNQEMLQILYGTLVRPHLEYAVTVWSPYQQEQKNILEKVQRRATKMISNWKNLSYEERLSKLDLMTTEERRRRGDMITTYKILQGNIDLGRSILEINTDSRTRGHNKKLIIKGTRKEYRRNFFTRRVQKEWNNLGQRVIESGTVSTFKKAYDQEKRTTQRGRTSV